MKSKLIYILLLLLPLFCFGQVKVDDNETFTLQDVVDVVNPTTTDLADCFADSNPDYFNATHKANYYDAAGDKNNLLMFRDYGAHNGISEVQYADKGNLNTVVGGTSLTADVPSGVASGDLLLLSLSVKTTLTSFSYHTNGFTQLTSKLSTSPTPWFKTYVFYKVAGPTENDWDLSFSDNITASVIIYRFTGVNATTPYTSLRSSSINTFEASDGTISGTTGDLGIRIMQSDVQFAGSYTGPGWSNQHVDTSSGDFTHNLYYYPFSLTESSNSIMAPYYNARHGSVFLLIKHE